MTDQSSPLVVGITGTAGSGKSVFAQYAAEQCGTIIDVDKIGRDLVESTPQMLLALQDRFGHDILDKNGNLQRKLLGERAFVSEKNQRDLNRIVWPDLIKNVKRKINIELGQFSKSMILVDMAILFESRSENLFDHICVVLTTEQRQQKWLMEKRGWTAEEVAFRSKAQLSDYEKAELADSIIQNDGDLLKLKEKAIRWTEKILDKSLRKGLIF
ncbi:dephospho-CoA kinase [bacterium]|nr:dephospho-CoA kinase [bacterium]